MHSAMMWCSIGVKSEIEGGGGGEGKKKIKHWSKVFEINCKIYCFLTFPGYDS